MAFAKTIASILLTAAAMSAAASVYAQSKRAPAVHTGILSCDTSAGIAAIINTKKQITCMFVPARRGARAVFAGTIEKFSGDRTSASSEMIWSVMAPPTRAPDALTGSYGGAGKEAPDALAGGLNRAVLLQPLPLANAENLAGRVSALELKPAR